MSPLNLTLTPTDKGPYHTSSNMPLLTDGDNHRNHHSWKQCRDQWHLRVPSMKVTALKAQGTLEKRRQKDCMRKSAMKEYLLEMV